MIFLKYITGAVDLFPWLCAAAAAHTVFDDGLFWKVFFPRGNIVIYSRCALSALADSNLYDPSVTPQTMILLRFY